MLTNYFSFAFMSYDVIQQLFLTLFALNCDIIQVIQKLQACDVDIKKTVAARIIVNMRQKNNFELKICYVFQMNFL